METLSQALIEANEHLKNVRIKFSGSIYNEVSKMNEDLHTRRPSSPRTMKSLIDDLALRVVELKNLRRLIERHEQISKKPREKRDIAWHRKALKLELDHNAKVVEAEHLKKLIRLKQLFTAFKGKKHKDDEKMTNNPTNDTYFVMGETKEKLASPEIPKTDKKTKTTELTEQNDKIKVKPKRSSQKELKNERSRWLTRENSTVQFCATSSGRNVWYDGQSGGRPLNQGNYFHKIKTDISRN